MAIPHIDKQLSALGESVIKAIQERFTVGDIVPYPYQCVAYTEIAKRMKNYEHPFFVKASVSAGKTIIFAMVAAQCKRMGLKMMVLARQAEIVDQDSEEISNFGVPNSIYCAGLRTKSAYFPIVVGSEGTVSNGMFKALGDYVPHVIGIDECHQVDWEDLAEAITTALGALPEPYRSVVILREIQGFSYAEIAEALELSMDAVKVHLHRGRRRLRERLVQEGVAEHV